MKRIIIGMSGATGSIYGIRLLQILRADKDVETHLVMRPFCLDPLKPGRTDAPIKNP